MKKSPFLVYDFSYKAEENVDPDNFVVSGYASINGNIDSYRDIVEPGAFAQDLIENGNERPMLWQHNSSKPIGIGKFEEKPAGLFVEMKLPKKSDFVSREVMPMIECGAVKGLSIGYFTKEETYDRDRNVNFLKRLELRETSVVTFPANTLAQITAAKEYVANNEDYSSKSVAFTMYPLADEKTVWKKSKAIKDIRANTNSTDEPSSSYKKGFMWYDSEDKDNFTAYKLPYVYWIDGGFKIIPRAIYAITGALSGARGGISIPSADESKIKGHINSIYKKLGKEEPFKKDNKCFIDQSTFKHMEKSDISSILGAENIILSTGVKDFIANSLCCLEDGPGNEEEFDLKSMMEEYKKSSKEILNGGTYY